MHGYSAVSAFAAGLITVSLCCLITSGDSKLVPGFHPRAIPLIVLNPAMAIWLKSDQLTDKTPEIWYSQSMSFTGYIRIDRVTYRWLGLDAVNGATANVTATPVLPQTDLAVSPTRTTVTFVGGGIQLVVTFLQPAFADDLEYYCRQYAYIDTAVTAIDGGVHTVQIYIDHTADVPVNGYGDRMVWADWSKKIASLNPTAKVLQMNDWQAVSFQIRGDETKMNWGDVLFATDSQLLVGYTQANATSSRNAFIQGESTPLNEMLPPRAANDNWLVSSFTFDYGKVATKPVSSYVVFAHNELFSIDHFHSYQQPYWKHVFGSWQNLLVAAFQEYASTFKRSVMYDEQIISDMTAIAGDEYATMIALIHRQVMGATVLTWNEERQQVWAFLKEQSTDGDVSTVDVVFPAAPFFVYHSPEVLRIMLLPLLDYANNDTYIQYNRAYAPHHLGIWPVGDILPKDQEDMPVEETSGMLIMLAMIAQQQQGNTGYLDQYRPLLAIWADYLNSSLPLVGDQLCTDDFEGHIPNNTNLALKGIIGMSAYSQLLTYFKQPEEAIRWQKQAQLYAQQWMVLALDTTSPPHFRLQYNLNNSWSMKYNLVFQYILGTNTFPDGVRTMENMFYPTKWNNFGLPLDLRHNYTKSDSSAWCAASNFDNLKQQQFILHNLFTFINGSIDRQPFPDLYDTVTLRSQMGLGRPVLGGLYAVALVNQRKMNLMRSQQRKPPAHFNLNPT